MHLPAGSPEQRLDWPVISLYILAVSLMIAHGIDSTRFAEWRLLGVAPWVYVLSYIPFTAFFLFGFVFLVRGEPRGYGMSLFVGLLVSSVIVLHTPQLFGGVRLFHTLESVTLIVGCAMAGLWLVAASAWRLGEYDRPGVRKRGSDPQSSPGPTARRGTMSSTAIRVAEDDRR